MKIIINQKEPFLIDLHVTLPPEHFEKAHQRILNQYQKASILPGFRKGKAPLTVIEKKYAREIKEEVFEKLTDEALEHALEAEQIDALYQPILQEQELHEDHSLYLMFTVTLRPKINVEPSDYSNLEVEVEKKIITTEKIVDDFFEMARHEFADSVVIEDRGLIMEDEALIDFEWKTEREDLKKIADEDPEFGDYFADDTYCSHCLNEETEVLPGLSQQLLGMRPEETRDIEITFPEDFYEERLRGMMIPYHITLHEITVKELSPIDDDLAAKIKPDSTLEELRKVITSCFQYLFDTSFEKRIEEAIKKKLIFNIPCELPSPLVAKAERALLTDFVRRCKEDDLTSDELQSQLGYFLPTVQETAISNITWVLIAQAIAEKEAFKLTAEELAERFDEVAKESDLSHLEFFKEAAKNNELDLMYSQALEKKVLKFLRSQTKVIEIPPAVEALES